MGSRLNPYLTFDGTTRQAMEFYREVFGGRLDMSTFGEFGVGRDAEADKIMHAMLDTDLGFALMASDLPEGMELRPGDNIAIAVNGDDVAELRGYWERLVADGAVTMPLEKQVWGDEFGMCTDRFGIQWMIDIGVGEQPATS
ncbi:VOC family protein [Bounagaea algeriensis]